MLGAENARAKHFELSAKLIAGIAVEIGFVARASLSVWPSRCFGTVC
jgi:hypothetical protein